MSELQFNVTVPDGYDYKPIIVPVRRAKCKDFVMLFQDFLLELSKDREITLEASRVLHFILAKLVFDNWVCMSQQAIADEIGMKQPNVNKAIKLLVRKEILMEGQRQGMVKTYALNPFFGAKAKARNVVQLRDRWTERQLQS